MHSDQLRESVRTHPRIFVATILAISAILWTGVAAFALLMRDVATDLPDRDKLRSIGTLTGSTDLLDVHGRTISTISKVQRIEVPLDRISPHIVRAIVSAEDQRFYDHRGIDLVRIGGALVHNILEVRVAEGGSTITQQLIRQRFLGREKTLVRKTKEALLAVRLEETSSKSEILELYLNTVYFGNGLYGVEAAALGFFGRHASEVSVAEAALLAGLLKAPSRCAPTVNPDCAVMRRNVVLKVMQEAGAIDAVTYGEAVEAPLQLSNALPPAEATGDSYFKEEVRKELIERLGSDRLAQGGLRVYTTLDVDMQASAEREVRQSLEEIGRPTNRARRSAEADPLQAALIALDPRSGEVRAMVGGREFQASSFNRAVHARRQAGSTFKPFVYAAALERGQTPATVISELNTPVDTLEGDWVPEDGGRVDGAMTMRMALRTSSNRAAVRMLEDVGIPATVEYAERLGLSSLPAVPSLALGAGEVSLLSMTTAFGAFANHGLLVEPSVIKRVETVDGRLLYENSPRPRRVLSEATAFIMTSMLADVVDRGTGSPARRVGFRMPAAGKTGTTNDYHDAWFIGYTPKLVTGVWIGYDQPRTIAARGYASVLAVPLWGRFMKAATVQDEPEPFSPPDNVKAMAICRLSGKRATDGCGNVWTTTPEGFDVQRSMVYTEYFVEGSEPVDFCPYHTGGSVDPLAVSTSGFREVSDVPVAMPTIGELPDARTNALPPREVIIPKPVDPPAEQARPQTPTPPPSSSDAPPPPQPPPASQAPPSPQPPPATQPPQAPPSSQPPEPEPPPPPQTP